MDACTCEHDERWTARRNEIPRIVSSAEKKFRTPPRSPNRSLTAAPAADVTPGTIDETIAVFARWLDLSDMTALYAVLGTVAANMLPQFDPVWLGVIAPPSSAKTELLRALSKLPHVVEAATFTPAGLLSGTPKKQRDKYAKGGLLNQIGEFGIIVLKDFGSILQMRPDAKAELLAALREIYDGSWTRVLGTDGGRQLTWKGKVGLVFASTQAIDTFYGFIGAMGDRFLFSRTTPTSNQFDRALSHINSGKQMRTELADAVARLFAGRRQAPQPINEQEQADIKQLVNLIVRLRGARRARPAFTRARGRLWRRRCRPHRHYLDHIARRPRYARRRSCDRNGRRAGRSPGTASRRSGAKPTSSSRPTRDPPRRPSSRKRSACRHPPFAARSKT